MKMSIATRVNLFVGILVVVPVIFLGWFFFNHQTTTLNKQLTIRAETLVNNLAQNCKYGILVGDRDDLRQTLNRIANNQDVSSAIAEDKNSNVLAYAGKRKGEAIKEFSKLVTYTHQSKEEASLSEYYPAKQEKKEVIGKVIVSMSMDDVNQKTGNLRRILLLVLGGVILIMVVGAMLGVRFLIQKPLQHLISSVETIGIGDFNHRVQIKSNDEIGKLADSFNMMTENLSKSLVSKNYVNNILESMNDCLLVFNPLGHIQTVNKATLNLLEYTEEQIVGEHYQLVMPNEKELFDLSKLPDILKRNVIHQDQEKTFFKRDGTPLAVSFSATLMYDNMGNVQGFIAVAQDITEKKLAEREKELLEHRLRLAEKMEALGRLAGGVAHDLNNTLGAIVGYPDLLLRKLPKDSPHLKAVNTIKQSGLKAGAIVRDLLTLARRGISKSEVLSLNDLVAEYLKSAEFEKLAIHHPEVKLVTRPADNLLNLRGSPVHLSKTIMNMVTNAAEAIVGNGTVTITTDNRYVDEAIQGDELGLEVGEYVVLKIMDTGIGIAPEDIKRIFEPFFTKKEMGRSGTGLGMAVVWGTVKDHNGYIAVKSTEGSGTCFELFFPATRADRDAGKKTPLIDEYMGNGEAILVVDDVKEQRDISTRLLNNLGYTAYSANSGEEAVTFLENMTVDLMVLDMIMEPGMDGLETFQKVQKLFPGTKAIIASGYAETERVREAQKLGAGAYIQKPYTLEKIGLAVMNELGKSN